MPKRKNPSDIDPTTENIEQYVFPKKVRDAIHRIAETDNDEPESEESVDQESSGSSRG